MLQSPLGQLTRWLRAAGEPTRLRLLALCSEGSLSVSDLAHSLRQSEPRVSRHLKILCESGLLERLRQGQWVHYRLASAADASSFVRGLLGQLDRRDPLLLRDASGARATAAAEGETARYAAESRLGRALVQLLAASGGGQHPDSVLLVGVAHLELLEWAARSSRHCTALAPSRRAAQAARAFAERRGVPCRVLTQSALESFDAGRAGAPEHFDVVLLDHPAASGELLVRLLEGGRRLMQPEGRLWIFEPYDALEVPRERVVEHPLARLRRLLAAAGLRCERLSPVEADGAHVLAAVARAEDAARARGLTAEGAGS